MTMLEIERKFLVTGSSYREGAKTQTHIIQGFLNTDPERTVRIRIRDNKGMLTVKGKSSESGLSRFEWETTIPVDEAKALLQLCRETPLEKTRYEIDIDGHLFEVDEFHGRNAGLIVAEIELESEDTEFPRPSWLSEEVTGDPKYYNSQLIQHPYDRWNK